VRSTQNWHLQVMHQAGELLNGDVVRFLLSSSGNLLVIVVILGHRQMRNVVNFCLANLAVADLSVGIFCVLPNLSLYMSPQWLIGRVSQSQFHIPGTANF
jgi:hypothetical protein